MAETGARVPLAPYALSYAGVQSRRPVRGGLPQWGAYAEQCNWLLGRGGALIPWACCSSVLTVGATHTFRFKVFPRYAATRRMWRFLLETTGTGGRTWGTFTDPSGGTTDYSMGGTDCVEFFHVETIAARTASETELAPTISVDGSATKAPTLIGIACFEVPRPELTLDTNDYGVAVSTCEPGAQVLDGTTGYSVGAVADAVAQADTIAQRNGLFHFAVDTSRALSTTAGTWTRAFSLGADPILLGRKQYRGSTTKTVEVRAYCRAGATTAGSLRFTMTSGGTLTLTITSGMAATWLSGTLDVDCEDLTDSYGRRSTRHDKCVIEWQRTSGANSIYLESISIGKG